MGRVLWGQRVWDYYKQELPRNKICQGKRWKLGQGAREFDYKTKRRISWEHCIQESENTTWISPKTDHQWSSAIWTNKQYQQDCVTVENGCTTVEETWVEDNKRLNLTAIKRAQNEELAMICQNMDNGDMY